MFEWDENKNRLNKQKHGLGFEEAKAIFDGPVLSNVDERFDYGEERTISIGTIADMIFVVVVHVDRQTRKRIISARLANRRERKRYREHFQGTT